MRGPQGPPGRAGPQGPQGQSVDPGVVSQTIEAKIKAMHGSELEKAKRMAEEAVKRASSQGKQLERISSQELSAATGAGATSATGAGATGAGETGMDGLEEQRENASQRLNAAKLDAKAALTVAKAEGATGSDGENLDSIDGGEANKEAAAKVESMKIKKQPTKLLQIWLPAVLQRLPLQFQRARVQLDLAKRESLFVLTMTTMKTLTWKILRKPRKMASKLG